MKSVEQQFEELASQTAGEATGIKCSISEYIDGLDTIIDVLNEHKAAAKEDLKRQEESGKE